ncbi:hypothetical protein ACLKA6_006046 [Drosophila palustris]
MFTRSQSQRADPASENAENTDGAAGAAQLQQSSPEPALPVSEIQKSLTDAMATAAARQTDQLIQALNMGFQSLLTAVTSQNSPLRQVESIQPDNQAGTLPRPTTDYPQQTFSSRGNSNPRVTPLSAEIRPDRISQIISNWKIRYSNKSAMSIDDFIYRIEALTEQTLGGNMELLAQNMSNLLDGSANECCIGGNFAKFILESDIPYKPIDSYVRTADGQEQRIMALISWN